MTAANFKPSLKRVLVHEGGWSNHPKDPGGVTLNGIIQRVYDSWRQRQGKAKRALTPKMAKEAEFIRERDAIYRQQYWDAIQGDKLPIGVDYCVFDGAVNSGPVQSARWLQRALAAVKLYTGSIDGHIGQGTLLAVEQHPNHDALVESICEQRMAFLQNLRTWSTFGKGWGRRVRDVETGAMAMASGKRVPKASSFAADEQGKGDGIDTKVMQTPKAETEAETMQGAAGGASSFSLMNYFEPASTALSQISGLPEWLAKYVIFAGIVAGFTFLAWTVGKAGWGLYSTWRIKRAAEKERAEQSALVTAELTPAPERERIGGLPRLTTKRKRTA